MGERIEHLELVSALDELLALAGFLVTALDGPRRPRPRSFAHYRPDLVAEDVIAGLKIIGEAKLEDDLFTNRSLRQFRAFSRILEPRTPPSYARFVLAVPGTATEAASEALALAGASRPNVTVAARSGDRWLITSHRLHEAALWRGYALRTRLPSSRFAAPSMPPGSAAGAATLAAFRASLISPSLGGA